MCGGEGRLNQMIFFIQNTVLMEVHGLILPLMELNDDFGSATVSQTGLDGTSLRIRITMNVNENDEIFEVDNITVTGSRYADVLCLGNSTTLGGSPSATWSGAANPSITYSWTPTTG